MHDPLSRVVDVEKANLVRHDALDKLAQEIIAAWHSRRHSSTGCRFQDMIQGSEGQFGVSDAPLAAVKLLERNGTAHLIQEMPIDMHQERAVAQVRNDMVVPNFVEQGSRSDCWIHAGLH